MMDDLCSTEKFLGIYSLRVGSGDGAEFEAAASQFVSAGWLRAFRSRFERMTVAQHAEIAAASHAFVLSRSLAGVYSRHGAESQAKADLILERLAARAASS